MKKRRWWAWGIGAFFVLALLGSFVGDEPAEPRAEEIPRPARPSVNMSVDVDLDGSRVTVTGTTNLVDGTVVRCEASFQGVFDDNVVQNHQTHIDLGKVTVSSGVFVASGDVSALPPGRNKVYCVFLPALGGQPQNVVDEYGDTGQLLSGPSGESDGGMQELEAESYFQL